MQARASLVQLLRLLHAVFQLDADCEPGALGDLYSSWLHIVIGFGQRCSPSLAAVWCQALQQVRMPACRPPLRCSKRTAGALLVPCFGKPTMRLLGAGPTRVGYPMWAKLAATCLLRA